ncbi:Imm52 family immunity protein [Streptomyces sp. NPDC058620]|uniref:Imm52 family immunity protein n=1 Tax=Streptomyces sp. NPDC058620 TaxID=3346560 RepID=UPI00364CC2F0
MQRVVRGFWGPRQESAEALARRWKQTLDRLAGLLPEACSGAGKEGAWRNVPGSGAATALRPDEESLLDAVRAAQAADGWSDRTGSSMQFVAAGGPGWKVDVSGRAGGTSEYLLQTVVIGIRPPDGAEVPDAALLAAVAEVWEADFGGVSSDDVLDALEDDGGFAPDEPSVGWIGYLSSGRAAVLPDDITGARKEVGSQGVLLDIAGPGDVREVLRANLRLREAGALQPLPRPMDRAAL